MLVLLTDESAGAANIQVSPFMSTVVVDLFQVVQIDHDNRKLRMAIPDLLIQLAALGFKGSLVLHPGQSIPVGDVRHVDRLLLRLMQKVFR